LANVVVLHTKGRCEREGPGFVAKRGKATSRARIRCSYHRVQGEKKGSITK